MFIFSSGNSFETAVVSTGCGVVEAVAVATTSGFTDEEVTGGAVVVKDAKEEVNNVDTIGFLVVFL